MEVITGDLVREIMTSLGLTMAALGDLLDVHQNTVARWVSARQTGKPLEVSCGDVLLQAVQWCRVDAEAAKRLGANLKHVLATEGRIRARALFLNAIAHRSQP